MDYLECEVSEENNILKISPPSYRFDLNIAEDIVEEAARFYGYSCLPRSRAKYQAGDLPHAPMYLFEEKVRKSLLLSGLQEIINIDLISELEKVPVLSCSEGHLNPKLSNPSSADQSFLRSSLLGGSLSTLKRNLSFHNINMHCFELGKVYYQSKSDSSVIENTHVSVLLSGLRNPPFWGNEKPIAWNFFDLKGIIESLLSKLGMDECLFEAKEEEAFHPGQCASLSVKESKLGVIGMLHPKLTHSFGLPKDIFYAELNLDALLSIEKNKIHFTPLASFPSSGRDWTVSLKKSADVGPILQSLKKIKHKLLESVELLSIYEDKSIGEDKKNISFRFIYRDSKKTLSLEAVEKTHEYTIKQAQTLLAPCILD